MPSRDRRRKYCALAKRCSNWWTLVSVHARQAVSWAAVALRSLGLEASPTQPCIFRRPSSRASVFVAPVRAGATAAIVPTHHFSGACPSVIAVVSVARLRRRRLSFALSYAVPAREAVAAAFVPAGYTLPDGRVARCDLLHFSDDGGGAKCEGGDGDSESAKGGSPSGGGGGGGADRDEAAPATSSAGHVSQGGH